MKKTIALVIPGFSTGGGVPAVGKFLYGVINDSENYCANIISVSGHYKDANNVRMINPLGWREGIKASREEQQGIPFTHYGTFFPEIPQQTFAPRKKLTEKLNQFDMVQIVAGSLAWAYLAKFVVSPVALQVATLIKVERKKKINSRKALRKLYQKYATSRIHSLEHKSIKYVDHIFVENSWMYDEMKKRITPEKVTFAPPGVNTKLYTPLTGTKSEQPYLLSVGRFSDPRKNTRLLLEAYTLLKNKNLNTPRLVLAGKSAPSTEDMAFAKAKGVDKHIDVKVNVSVEQLISLYQHAELFVLSSDEEGFGMVIMEAMACGTPVISTDCGGPSTLIEDGVEGYLTPVGDPKKLAEKINDLLTDTDKRRVMARNARNTIMKSFSLDQAGKKFIKVYDNLI